MKISTIDGLRALVVLEGGWREEYAAVIAEHGLQALSIRVDDDDLSFLRGLTHLRGLVLNAGEIRDLTVLEELKALETITLNVPSRPRMTVSFAAFPRLTRLGMYWNPGFESVFGCRQLQDLFVFGPPDSDLGRFAALKSLRRLELSQGRRLTTLDGVQHLTRLELLGLYLQSSLAELAGVEALRSLKTLSIESCKKIERLEPLGALTQLERLKLANCREIASLAPLAGLHRLEALFAWESTNILDGDLAVLLELPHLREVAMMDRRHYRPRVPELKAALAQREPLTPGA